VYYSVTASPMGMDDFLAMELVEETTTRSQTS
jgi:hypothetical protein